ncbi:MAG TPA: RodZ domain-containing protein [Anaerolineae bacterium]|nr:RodZ domain-containing protein [Anaerolineae bacterium]
MGEVGTRLREAREQQGLSLEQAEETTRIRRVFLEALEEERFDVLPGDVYARGFIRNYAQFLGLDPQELSASFRAVRGKAPARYVPRVLDEPLVPRPGSNRWAGIFLAFMLLAVVALGAWYIYQRYYLGVDPGSVVIPQLIPNLGKTATGAITTGPVATAIGPQPTKVAQPTSLPNVEAAHPPPTVSATAETTPTASGTALPSPTPTQSPTSPTTPTPPPSTPIRVEARALETTWLRVYLDGELVFGNFMQEGEYQVWDAEREISLRIGNAAGLRLTVNGVEVGSLGGAGEVVVVEYTVDSLPES